MSTYDQCTLEEVREALSYVDPNDRDMWVRMGFAVRSEFFDAGFDAWDAWSSQAGSYKAASARSTWRSCKASGASGGIGIGSLFHEAKANGWKPRRVERTAEEKAEAKRKQEQWAEERAELVKAEQARIKRMQLVVSSYADKVWNGLEKSGTSPYLDKKKVRAHGLRFCQRGMVVVTDVDRETITLITGQQAISQFFDSRTEETSFLYLKPGVIAMPLCDWHGSLWNIQFIYQDGGKKFMKAGRKQGCFHLFGDLTPRTPLCIAEGYATGASIHEATDFPVAITLDCGNLKPVAVELRRQLDDQPLLICGDDDVDTDGNPGRKHATEVAQLVGARVVFPIFELAG